MKKFLLGACAFALTLGLCSAASAQGRFDPRLAVDPRLPVGPRVAVDPWVGVGPATRVAYSPYGVPGRAFAARPYYLDHGVRYRGGYYYAGRLHNHWSWSVWNPQFNRYHYWDPYLSCYYYYCPVRACYLPCGGLVP